MDSLIGKTIDGYRIERLLGRGGMASVYHAIDISLQRDVAIKVIDPRGGERMDYATRFQREARAVAGLRHPNIVGVYRSGHADGIYYMAMDFINGPDLRRVIDAYQQDGELLAHKDVLQIIMQIASALDYAHSQGVIHRDVKPSNIMIDSNKNAILTDFGLALTVTEGTRGDIFGSPHYIAPEQAISSAGVVPQTDIYALGVALYEMLTGYVPFDDETPTQIAMAHMTQELPAPQTFNPELPESFNNMLATVLEKEPEKRYPNGDALVKALRKAIKEAEKDEKKATRKACDLPEHRKNLKPLKVSMMALSYKVEGISTPISYVQVTHSTYALQQTQRRRNRPLLIVLLIALIIGTALIGRFASSLQTDAPTTVADLPVNILLEGVVTSIDGSQIRIFDTTVIFDDDGIVSLLETGDTVYLRGNFSQNDIGLVINQVTDIEINGDVLGVNLSR